MFQLPQNEIYVDSRNWKTCLLLYALRDAYKSRDKQQLHGAKTIKLLHLFLMQRIDYILTKKGNFNEICTMFIGPEKEEDYYILTCT